jgi:hypothetical protein
MDWRLTNPRNYLTGVSLTRRTWDYHKLDL